MGALHLTNHVHLGVDNFGVKYVNKEDVYHLINALKENYTVTEDWEGKRYIGIHL